MGYIFVPHLHEKDALLDLTFEIQYQGINLTNL